MRLWVFLHYLIFALRQRIKVDGTLSPSSTATCQLAHGRSPPDIGGFHLDGCPLLGLLDLVGPLCECDNGGQDDIDEFEVEGLRQVEVQRVLVLLRLVLGHVLDYDAEEGEEALFHLVPEVGLTRADDGQEDAGRHRGYLADRFNDFLRFIIGTILLLREVKQVVVGVGQVAAPDDREEPYIVEVLAEEVLPDRLVYAHPF